MSIGPAADIGCIHAMAEPVTQAKEGFWLCSAAGAHCL